MSCSCGNGLNPFNRIMDLDVVYTGNGGECNDKKIYEGMRLREVLDILVSNCSDGGDQRGSALFTGNGVPSGIEAVAGDIYFNMSDGSIYQFGGVSWTDTEYSIAGGGEAVWGSITGSVEDQADLVAYILANGLPDSRVGNNLHIDENDNSLNLGVSGLEEFKEFYNILAINPYNEPIQATDLQDWAKGLIFLLNKDDPSLSQTLLGLAGTLELLFNALNVRTGSFSIRDISGTNPPVIARFNAESNIIDFFPVNPGEFNARSNAFLIGNSPAGCSIRGFSDGNLTVRSATLGSRILISAPRAVGSVTSTVANITFQNGNINILPNSLATNVFYGLYAGNVAREVGMRTVDDTSGTHVESCFELQGWDGGANPSNYIRPFFRYRDGMPRESQITDNVIPTIGYIRDTLIANAVTAAVTPLQNQITALEARIAALEP